ncbi:hypothetical protein [Streptomyces sp. NPDC001404]|uniref:hypothetical protein n=1 Tax=Streptomyces sp. NPDC001404 TaxID=3364571 RepID=UPI003690916B
MSGRPDPGPLCRCGHSRDKHNTITALGGAQCRSCPGDDERSWRHIYTPDNHPVAAGPGCYGPHCAALDTLERINALASELYELSANCPQPCGATRIADRILAALDQPQDPT